MPKHDVSHGSQTTWAPTLMGFCSASLLIFFFFNKVGSMLNVGLELMTLTSRVTSPIAWVSQEPLFCFCKNYTQISVSLPQTFWIRTHGHVPWESVILDHFPDDQDVADSQTRIKNLAEYTDGVNPEIKCVKDFCQESYHFFRVSYPPPVLFVHTFHYSFIHIPQYLFMPHTHITVLPY